MSDAFERSLERVKHPPGGVDAAIGAGAVAAEALSRVTRWAVETGRPVVQIAMRPPLVPRALHPERLMDYLAVRGRREITVGIASSERLWNALVPKIVDAVLDRIDLTELVRKRVDLDSVVADVDIDAVASRLDVEAVVSHLDFEAVIDHIDMDAIINRIDLVALAEKVIEGIDLPEVIRDSTGSMASELVQDVRMRSIQADKGLSGLIDRLLLRRRAARDGSATASPEREDSSSSQSDQSPKGGRT